MQSRAYLPALLDRTLAAVKPAHGASGTGSERDAVILTAAWEILPWMRGARPGVFTPLSPWRHRRVASGPRSTIKLRGSSLRRSSTRSWSPLVDPEIGVVDGGLGGTVKYEESPFGRGHWTLQPCPGMVRSTSSCTSTCRERRAPDGQVS